MGAGASTPDEDSRIDNIFEKLDLVVGEKPIPSQDNGYSLPLRELLLGVGKLPRGRNLRAFHNKVELLCTRLSENTVHTHNLSRLVMHLVFLLKNSFPAENEENLYRRETLNCLLLVRTFFTFFIENHTHPVFFLEQDIVSKDDCGSPLMAQLTEALAGCIIAKGQRSDSEPVELQLESVHFLLVLLASHMCGCFDLNNPRDPVIEVLSQPHLVHSLVQCLLLNYIPGHSNESAPSAAGSPNFPFYIFSFLVKNALYAYSYVADLLGYHHVEGRNSSDDIEFSAFVEVRRLKEASLLLLLALVHPSDPSEPTSPFRKALNSIKDVEGSEDGYCVPFVQLYDSIASAEALDERAILLLYFLLEGNPAFAQYVLIRTDCDTLLLPLLRILYSSVEHDNKLNYMIIIIILILSHDQNFNINLHSQTFRTVPWYREHYLVDITLGGLLVLVLVRTVQLNLRKLRDLYLHTSCLAALANMAPYFSNLPSFSALRLVKLLDLIVIKCNRLKRISRDSLAAITCAGDASAEQTKEVVEQYQHAEVDEGAGDNEDPESSVSTYTGFLGNVLEIITSALSHGLERNPHLVYSLLHRQDLFNPLAKHPKFSLQARKILEVLQFFQQELKSLEEVDWSVENIVQLIQHRSHSCPLTKEPRVEFIEFKYEEEPASCDFFDPYVWQFVYEYPEIVWNPKSVTLFCLPQQENNEATLETTVSTASTLTSGKDNEVNSPLDKV